LPLSEPRKPWAFCSAPAELIDSVDVWERNRFVSAKDGKEIFVQHIFWRVSTHDEETDFFVSAWRMNKQVLTIPNREGQWFVARFYDPKEKVFRVIRAKQFLETETTVDYEAADRLRMDDSNRSGLRK
jgi:hypothetical protein